jgi:polysaccharide deacetylase family protein (PEP-CTERM system associated)
MALHCLSIDVEGFCEGMAEAFPVPAGRVGSAAELDEVAANVEEILAWLARREVRATFFTLGVIAEARPALVRSIAEAGHEVASHSQQHRRLYNLARPAAREAIRRSKLALEAATGRRVYGFRAPDFSVTAENLHLLDEIGEAGYTYDSSIAPISLHDVYGVPGAAREIHRLPNGLIEFPPATVRVLGQVVPVLGGGYFRLLPLWLSRQVMAAYDRAEQPVMTYTHPYEVGSQRPRLAGLSPGRRFRHYVGIDRSRPRFDALMGDFAFGRATDVLTKLGYEVTRDLQLPDPLTGHLPG